MYDSDAIFKAGKIHGCEDELYLIYLVDEGNDPRWNIGHITRDAILEADAERVHTGCDEFDAGNFWDILVDCIQDRWYSEEYDPDNYCDLSRQYDSADFIVGRDGNIYDEMMFMINWAKEA